MMLTGCLYVFKVMGMCTSMLLSNDDPWDWCGMNVYFEFRLALSQIRML